MAAPNDYASSASWFINAPAPVGNKRLRAVEKFDDDDDGGSVETRTEVGPGTDAAGFVTIPGGKKLSFDIRETKGDPEVDWEYLKETESPFALTKRITGGREWQFTPCRVSTIKNTGDNKAEIMFTVEIVALGKKRL